MVQPEINGRVLGYRESQVVTFILRYYLAHCKAPTRREIQEDLGISTKGEVTRIIKRIEARGIVRSGKAERYANR